MTSAHEVTQTRLCREPGCPEETTGAKRGLWAVYCDRHARERSRNTRTQPRQQRNGAVSELVGELRALETLARRIDRQRAARAKLVEQAQEASRVLGELEEELRERMRTIAAAER